MSGNHNTGYPPDFVQSNNQRFSNNDNNYPPQQQPFEHTAYPFQDQGYPVQQPGDIAYDPTSFPFQPEPSNNGYYPPQHFQPTTPSPQPPQHQLGAPQLPYSAAYTAGLTSAPGYIDPRISNHLQQPSPAANSPWQHQQLQQLQLQQHQQHIVVPQGQPSGLTHSPLNVPAGVPPPAPIPPPTADALTGQSPEPTIRKITLRLPQTATDTTMSRRHSSRSAIKTESPSDSHRPRRAATTKQPNYNVDDGDDDDDFDNDDERRTPSPPPKPARGKGRPAKRAQHDDDDDEDAEYDEGVDAVGESEVIGTRRSTRGHKAPQHYADADAFEDQMLTTSPVIEAVQKPIGRRGRYRVVDPDEEEEGTPVPATNGQAAESHLTEPYQPEKPTSQRSRGGRNSSADAESFAPSERSNSPSASSSPDAIADDYLDDDTDFIDDGPRRRPARSVRTSTARRSTRNSRRHEESEDEVGPGRTLRTRGQRVNYTLPPPELTAAEIAAAQQSAEIINQAMGRGRGRPPVSYSGFGAMGRKPAFPWMTQGREGVAKAMGDSSDSDDNLQMPGPSRLGGGAGGGAAPAGPNVPGPTDVPNFGRFNPKSSTADADPLGVDVNVTFDRVGGLDGHIDQLKEMVALPLLYPELFQQFGIIPPRGVLFHGPPGTGKTLLARALAASCSNGNTKISFFMRKGADVLSKWVGEAERQLRMLFEEARASQPSIIFFDEIDGLAPVRSSKQDQIHASLVSTLLALMDGMDGRGQVIVIGATNRPDAVDPALRRPGRFDREFYFPLPNLDARRQIIKINTRDWEPQLPEEMLNTLATLTKGYGGADLRALSTEAALNAIQRRYPQIYKTSDRLQVQPGSIRVQPKDFMLAVKKIIPSSARSASSAAMQLPRQLVPLLSKDLERLKTAVDRVLPPVKKRTALEEAEFEDEDGDTFEKELMLQSLDKLRTYRPRLMVYGPRGSGQTYLGPAILHHLEGFHVQSFDLATLMSDSTRTTEAAIVQLFVEAKRHQPSIIFIPSLSQWSATVSETARSTTRALLDGIPPSDPVLLLAIVDGELSSLPSDVRSWFGFGHENRLELNAPSATQRGEFFSELLESIERRPTDFPDGVPRKRRVLEVLPLAEPLPPRQPTEAELAREVERDNAARNMITLSFTSLVSEFMKKYRRPVYLAKEAAMQYAQYMAEQAAAEAVVEAPPAVVVAPEPVNGELAPMEVSGEAPVAQLALMPPAAETHDSQVTHLPESINTLEPTQVTISLDPAEPVASTASEPPAPKVETHDIDIDSIQQKLIRHKYYTPAEFLADIAKIEENSRYMGATPEQLKVSEMCAHAKSHVQTFDPKWNPEFERYAQRMHQRRAERKAKREKEKAEAEAKEKEKEKDEPVNGTAEPAATVAETNGSPSEVNGLKRPREEGEADGAEGAPAEKRARETAMDVDPIEVTPSTQLTAHDPIISTQNESADPPVKEGTPVPTPPPRTPTPPPVYPAFVVPSQELEQLGNALKHSTSSLNVEELEQLRAMLLDSVWRMRTEWDRTQLVGDMLHQTASFVSEVKEVREAERRERERLMEY